MILKDNKDIGNVLNVFFILPQKIRKTSQAIVRARRNASSYAQNRNFRGVSEQY